MILKVVGTGSAGNCYLLEAKDATLIVEVGVRFQHIKKALDFNLRKVCGAIITHEHGDHCAGAREAADAGINLYMSKGTRDYTKFQSHRKKVVPPLVEFSVGPFKILPFPVEHNAAEPYGFMINHQECGNLLFITDTCNIPHRFAGINNILIEANYRQSIMDQAVLDGKMDAYLRKKIMGAHMSIEGCKLALAENDLRQVNKIVLIHLSDRNSDEVGFLEEVKAQTGKTVHVAQNGMEIEFNKSPF